MTGADLAIVAAGGVIAVSIAYALGRRRAPAENRDHPPRATEKVEAPKPAPAEPAPTAAKAEAPPKAEEKPKEKPKAKAEAKPAEPAPTGDLAKLYEEDDNVDPTRVGQGAVGAAVQRTIYQPPLKRITYDPGADEDEPTHAKSMFLVHATAQTDRGLRRKRNEDAVLVVDSEALFVIADGMGGYQGGQLASQTAVKTMATAYESQEFEGPPHEGVPPDATNLARAIQMANAAILEIARQKPELEGMGTTLCAARFSRNKGRLFVGHVGDSRCYRMRKDVLKQVTADHTMADHGVTGPAAAQLSRAVGIWPTVPIDIIAAIPEPGDLYLLCSDGLTKMLKDEAIAEVLRSEEDPKAAVERLISSANAGGGKDNITVVLVRVAPPNWKPNSSAEATPAR
jgi:protein phosphatase